MSEEPTAPDSAESQDQPTAPAPQPAPPPAGGSCCGGSDGAPNKTSWAGIIFLAVVAAIVLIILWSIAS